MSRRQAGPFGSASNCILPTRMPTRDELLDLFRRSGALLDGHFRLTSGLHSTGYLQCALVLQHPAARRALGRAIAERTRDPGADRRAVAGARRRRHRPRGRARARRARALRRTAGRRADAAARLHARGTDRVLVVEDVLTTGGSTRETMQVATAAGGQVVGAASIVDRSGGSARVRRAVSRAARHRPADLRARCLPALRARAAGRQARVAAGGRVRCPHFKLTHRLRRHGLRRLAAAGVGHVDPGAARRRARRARRATGHGDRRRTHRRRRPCARTGRAACRSHATIDAATVVRALNASLPPTVRVLRRGRGRRRRFTRASTRGQELSLPDLERRVLSSVRARLRVAHSRRRARCRGDGAAAARLEGRHDFAAFQTRRRARRTTTERTVFSSRVAARAAARRRYDVDAATAFSGTWCAASSARSSRSAAGAIRPSGSSEVLAVATIVQRGRAHGAGRRAVSRRRRVRRRTSGAG